MTFTLKPYVIRVYLGALVVFLVNKFVVRPLTRGVDLNVGVEVFIYSSPNALEAIVGTTNIVVLLLFARARLGRSWRDASLYTLGALVAAVFVLTQEFRLHDLGGRNVYDPLDAVASVLGVLLMWGLFLRYGVLSASSETPGPTASA